MKMSPMLYVRLEGDVGEEYPVAEPELINAIEGNGPTTIGVYRLVETLVGKKLITTKVVTKKAKAK